MDWIVLVLCTKETVPAEALNALAVVELLLIKSAITRRSLVVVTVVTKSRKNYFFSMSFNSTLSFTNSGILNDFKHLS